ncbi:MAG: copper chaperone PCu(A)C [Sphingomonadaceae bacterium]|nr:copper chaperone PCu(A)C [Sphingomonadaceae bacterium]
MRLPMFAALLALLLSACGASEDAPSPGRVENVWVRLPAVDGRPAAAYFEISGGESGEVLIAIDSSRVENIELHETIDEDGVMRMAPIMTVEVPPGETIAFEPGGRHAMLFGISAEITPGTPLPLDFRFENGRDTRIEAVTIGAGDEAPFEEEN